jgi:protein BUR2
MRQQIAAVCIFLATKVEEHSRKLKELVIACCRVAQKNPLMVVDEQTKDYWRWRDTILFNEDVVLELLCFDLTIESPYKILYEMLKRLNVGNNKELRDTAWAFINDSNMTQLCLLFSSRTIAAASLYCAARKYKVEFPDDPKGRPWWEIEKVKIVDLRRAYNHMAALYEDNPLKRGNESIYVGGLTPTDTGERYAKTRLRSEQRPVTPGHTESETGGKLSREATVENGAGENTSNGNGKLPSRVPPGALLDNGSPVKRRKLEEEPESQATASNGQDKEADEGSEEGELDE